MGVLREVRNLCAALVVGLPIMSFADDALSVDWFDVLESTMLPSDAQYNMPDRYGVNVPTAIWNEQQWNEYRQLYTRDALVVASINGKTLTAQGKPSHWLLALLGPRSGYTWAELSSQLTTTQLDDVPFHQLIEKKGGKPYRCDGTGAASFGFRIYEITRPAKKTAWLKYEWSCGAAGCSADFVMYLNKSDVDQLDGTRECSS